MPATSRPIGQSTLRSAGNALALFTATLERDKHLKDLCERGGVVFRPFPMLLGDVFTFFHESAALLDTCPPTCDKLHYLVMKYLTSASEYAHVRSSAIRNYQVALSATEEFGERLLDHLSGDSSPSDSSESRPGGMPVEVEELLLADVAKAGFGTPPSPAILMLAKRVEQSAETTGALANVCHTFGIAPGEIRALPWAQRGALAAKMVNSANLRHLADLLGRWSSLAVARRAKRTPEPAAELSDITQGDDWHLFLPQEIGFLAEPGLQYDFFLRLIDRKIVQYDPQSDEASGRGPIVICLDTSGSMAGTRDVCSKAIALSLHKLAKESERPFAAILFSSAGEWVSFLFNRDSACRRIPSGQERRVPLLEGVVDFVTLFFGGGTDYESPLLEGRRLIDEGGVGWRDADLVFVTDDYCEVSEEFLREFNREKNRLGFRVFSVIVGAAAQDARTLRHFSDRVVAAADFDDQLAEQVFDAVRI